MDGEARTFPMPRPGIELTSVELHQTGTFEGRSTDWATAAAASGQILIQDSSRKDKEVCVAFIREHLS